MGASWGRPKRDSTYDLVVMLWAVGVLTSPVIQLTMGAVLESNVVDTALRTVAIFFLPEPPISRVERVGLKRARDRDVVS